jgi:hypothetical protein
MGACVCLWKKWEGMGRVFAEEEYGEGKARSQGASGFGASEVNTENDTAYWRCANTFLCLRIKSFERRGELESVSGKLKLEEDLGGSEGFGRAAEIWRQVSEDWL